MVAVGVRVDAADNERLYVLHPVPAVLSNREGGPVGGINQLNTEAPPPKSAATFRHVFVAEGRGMVRRNCGNRRKP
jgi:hypothetical protein